MSYLGELGAHAVLRANDRVAFSLDAASRDKETARRLAWLLYHTFGDRTIRVPFLFGFKWTVRLRDLRPLWVLLFGEEHEAEPGELDLPPAA